MLHVGAVLLVIIPEVEGFHEVGPRIWEEDYEDEVLTCRPRNQLVVADHALPSLGDVFFRDVREVPGEVPVDVSLEHDEIDPARALVLVGRGDPGVRELDIVQLVDGHLVPEEAEGVTEASDFWVNLWGASSPRCCRLRRRGRLGSGDLMPVHESRRQLSGGHSSVTLGG